MQIAWLPSAINDLQRLRLFIAEQNPAAAQRAVALIKEAVALLTANPFAGKTPEDLPDYHDIIIPFGAAGYVLRYRIQHETIFIVALKHAKEAGFNKAEPD